MSAMDINYGEYFITRVNFKTVLTHKGCSHVRHIEKDDMTGMNVEQLANMVYDHHRIWHS